MLTSANETHSYGTATPTIARQLRKKMVNLSSLLTNKIKRFNSFLMVAPIVQKPVTNTQLLRYKKDEYKAIYLHDILMSNIKMKLECNLSHEMKTTMGVLHLFFIKNTYDKMDFRLFYFHVTNCKKETQNENYCKLQYPMGSSPNEFKRIK